MAPAARGVAGIRGNAEKGASEVRRGKREDEGRMREGEQGGGRMYDKLKV